MGRPPVAANSLMSSMMQGTGPTPVPYVGDMMQMFLMQRDHAQRAADRHDADMVMMRFMR